MVDLKKAAKKVAVKTPAKKKAKTKTRKAPAKRKRPAKKLPARPPLTQLTQAHLMFVSRFSAQDLKDAPGAWMAVAGQPSMSREEAEREAAYLLDQDLIRAELSRRSLVFDDDAIARSYVATELFRISQANVFDFMEFRTIREPVRDKDGNVCLDINGRPMYDETERLMFRPDLDTLPRALQQNIKKIKVKRKPEGDEVELELHDSHKALNDIGRMAGIGDEDKKKKTGLTFADAMQKAAVRMERMAEERRQLAKPAEDNHEGS